MNGSLVVGNPSQTKTWLAMFGVNLTNVVSDGMSLMVRITRVGNQFIPAALNTEEIGESGFDVFMRPLVNATSNIDYDFSQYLSDKLIFRSMGTLRLSPEFNYGADQPRYPGNDPGRGLVPAGAGYEHRRLLPREPGPDRQRDDRPVGAGNDLPILEYEELPSTQDEARRIASQSNEWTVVRARRQTKGRGKPGSEWFSPVGGLYFSVILKPRKNPNELATITLAAARAVVSVIKQEAGIDAEIKLPNDVLIGGKKVCGILTEKNRDALIIGIGFNLNTEEFPKELNATSLFQVKGERYEVKGFLEKLISELKIEYSKYLNNKV